MLSAVCESDGDNISGVYSCLTKSWEDDLVVIADTAES